MEHRAHRHLVATLLLIAALAGSGCELITRADEYAVYEGLCNACPKTSLDLRHPPCPNESEALDSSEQFVFAARRLQFGKPADWLDSPDTFALGYDMDCSDRPNAGRPVLCRPIAEADANGPWERLPRGIDNSLATRIFAPLYEVAAANNQQIDLDATYSADQEAGRLGTLVSIENWNGTADDPSVMMSIYSSPGVSGENGAPRWDGTDEWDRYSDVPGNESKFFKVEGAEGYVANGVLVVDYRSRGDISYRFGSPENSFRIIVREVSFIGRLSADKLDNFNMIAVAPFGSIYEVVPEAAKVLSTCDPAAEFFLKQELGDLLIGAADMPTERGRPETEECDGITFAWALDAVRARFGGFKEASDLPPECL